MLSSTQTLVHRINQGPASHRWRGLPLMCCLRHQTLPEIVAWGQGVSGNVAPSYMACIEPSHVEASEVLD